MRAILLLVAGCCLSRSTIERATADDRIQIGAIEFELPCVDGNKMILTKKSAAPVTVLFFVGTECPLVKIFASRVWKTVHII